MKNEILKKEKTELPPEFGLVTGLWKGESNAQFTFSEGEPQIRTGRVAKVGFMVALQRPTKV